MQKIRIKIGDQEFFASLFNTPTSSAIIEVLPFTSNTLIWGDEIYFSIPADAKLEPDARDVVEIGDLAYWPSMPAFCIFFGPTPVSRGNEPRAASKVNVFGKMDEVNLLALKKVNDGDEVEVTLLPAS